MNDNNVFKDYTSIISREDLISKLFLAYGKCVELISHDKKFSMETPYVFQTKPCFERYPKEFSCTPKDILYRNWYWIDSEYKRKEIYYGLSKDINEGEYKENKIFKLNIALRDGYLIKFIPDYYNEETKSCLHYFDMSYFYGNDMKPREYLQNIFSFFEDNDKYELNYFIPTGFEKDVN